MAVNKNFVVKNGLEVNTDLIFADASTEKVGIGSTIPATQLDVIGGIAATDINVTGVGTIVTIRSTTGIVSTVDAISVQATNLNISGLTSVTDVSPRNINASGVTSTATLQVIGTGNIATGIITSAQGTNLNYTGISSITSGIVTHLVANNLNVGGISSVRSGIASHLVVDNLNVGGITSVRSGVVTHLAVNNLNVGGISTIGNFIVTKSSGGIGATVGANVGVITYYGDGANLLNTGSGIGIGSTGTDGLGASGLVGYGFTYLSFVGSGVSMVQYNTSVGIATVWIAGGGGGSGNVSIGSEAPGSPTNGDLWYSSEYGRTFIWFDEETLGIGNTAVWVDASPFNQGGLFLGKYGDNAYGAIGYTGGTTSQASVYFTGDPNTGLYQPSADHVGVVAGGTASLVVNPNGISVTGIITGNGSGLTGVASTDNIVTATAATFTNNVNVSGIFTAASAYVTGILTAQTLNYNNVTDIYSTGIITATGGIQQTGNEGFNNSAGISTFGADVHLNGSQAGVTSVTWDASADSLIFQDLSYAKFGAGGDLQLYHNGAHNYVYGATTGQNVTIGAKSGYINLQPVDNEEGIIVKNNGAVELYYDNSKKFQTDLHGTQTTGIGTFTSNVDLTPGTGQAHYQITQESGNTVKFGIVSGSNIELSGTSNNDMIFKTNDTERLRILGGGAITGQGVTINNTGIDMGIGAGVCTAYQFYGDGSNLTGIAAGGSGEFNTSISGATQYDVTNSMATAYTANASTDHRTIVHSIHICNISASEVTISGEIQSSFSFAHTIPVPAGSAVELLKQPKVLGPSETIELQASANSALEATIIVEYKEDTDFWDAQVDITSAATMTDIYTSTSNPSVVQSILLANDDGSADVKARVAWTDGSNNIQSYLCYDMVVPADATVELCEKPKYLASGYKLRGYANVADRLEITASGKQITS